MAIGMSLGYFSYLPGVNQIPARKDTGPKIWAE